MLLIAAKVPLTHEARLLRHIFDNYDNQVRPVYNRTHVVNVLFSLSLIQIVNVVSISMYLSDCNHRLIVYLFHE